MEVGMSGENTKVYMPQGGDELVVADGGTIQIETGGKLKVGDTDFAAILAAVPTTDQNDGATIWNDSGTLKVSTSA
jgi:hypothetical protein